MTAIIFDKTGTLTYGKPWVTDHHILQPGLTEQAFWFRVGSAEMGSEHPLGRAVVEYASTEGGQQLTHPAEFEAFVGKGVSCTVDNCHVRMTNNAKKYCTRIYARVRGSCP